MNAQDLLAPGMSAGAVALVFMFKMYIDRRRNGNGVESEFKKLRNDLRQKERREEMKPLAEAITQLTMAVKEMHASHQMQVEVLKGMSNQLSGRV